MKLNPVKPRKALNKAWLKTKPNRKVLTGIITDLWITWIKNRKKSGDSRKSNKSGLRQLKKRFEPLLN